MGLYRSDLLAGPDAGSPKFHAHVAILPDGVVDASVNCVGLARQEVSAEKIATGAAFTVTGFPPGTLSLQPLALVTVTEYVPLAETVIAAVVAAFDHR